ncbi:MAG: type II secretion system protein [Phycisphaerales bacterium]|jgi:prepilin-type N-terminal cleavage/methylation domain-containing protein
MRLPRVERRRGFSIVELLVAMAIVVTLIALLVVAVERAMRSGQQAQTEFLMGSIEQGLTQFRADHGYLPPVLGRSGTAGSQNPGTIGYLRDVIAPPQNAGQQQGWLSITTLAEYLLGYGDRSCDGYGAIGNPPYSNPNAQGVAEIPTLGLRGPGRDGAWGSIVNPRDTQGLSRGVFLARNPGDSGVFPNAGGNAVQIEGRVYGPYLELQDERLLGAVTGVVNGNPVIAFPGEIDNFDDYPKVLCDYWGSPIHYFRRPYLGSDPGKQNLNLNLGDVAAIRPWEVPPGQDIDGYADASTDIPGGDSTTTRDLLAAEFALLSPGPDRAVNLAVRRDQAGANEDNLVKVAR